MADRSVKDLLSELRWLDETTGWVKTAFTSNLPKGCDNCYDPAWQFFIAWLIEHHGWTISKNGISNKAKHASVVESPKGGRVVSYDSADADSTKLANEVLQVATKMAKGSKALKQVLIQCDVSHIKELEKVLKKLNLDFEQFDNSCFSAVSYGKPTIFVVNKINIPSLKGILDGSELTNEGLYLYFKDANGNQQDLSGT